MEVTDILTSIVSWGSTGWVAFTIVVSLAKIFIKEDDY